MGRNSEAMALLAGLMHEQSFKDALRKQHRMFLAAAALQGLLANPEARPSPAHAVDLADATLRILEGDQQ